jgi:hypothetical protein
MLINYPSTILLFQNKYCRLVYPPVIKKQNQIYIHLLQYTIIKSTVMHGFAQKLERSNNQRIDDELNYVLLVILAMRIL